MPAPSASQREGDAPYASFIPAPDTDTAMLTPQPALQTMKAVPDTFLDPWRTARSCAAQSLLQWASSLVAQYEASLPARGKARKAADLVRWQQMIEAVVSALALFVLAPPPTGWLVLPRSKANDLKPRYRRPTQGKPLARLQDYLEAVGLAVVIKGHKEGTATTIAPTALLADHVRTAMLQPGDFGRRRDRELVVLRATNRKAQALEKRLVDYEETLETLALRVQVVGFNAQLATATIAYVGNSGVVDTSDRQLRRHFTVKEGDPVQFNRGGRYFGGFWQNLKKDERQHLRINSEPVVAVDYSAAFTHIAFAHLGETPPPVADLYRIPGLEGLGRKQIKSALNTLYFDNFKRSRWPDEFGEIEWADPDTGEVFEGIPARFTPALVRAAIVAHYPALDHVLCKGLGLQFMFSESQILGRLLTDLRERGITALPMHDALMVALSDGPAVATLMEDMAMEIIGLKIPVTVTTY
jgi:hypothetical protein